MTLEDAALKIDEQDRELEGMRDILRDHNERLAEQGAAELAREIGP